MLLLVLLSCLGLVLGSTPEEESKRIHDMLDIVESGLDSNPQGRALFVTVTLTSTSVVPTSAVLTSTVIPQCYTLASAVTQCPATGKRRRSIPEIMLGSNSASTIPENPFPNAIVTTSDGTEVDIRSILPTPVSEGPVAPDTAAFDAVVQGVEGDTQSGRLEWSEVELQNYGNCGRSDKRARILQISNTGTVVTSTSYTTTTSALATATLTVEGITCTSAGFSFAIPACP